MLECLYCFIISAAFCIVYNIKGRDVLYGGLGSALGWAVYLGCYRQFGSVIGGYFLGTVVTTLYSEFMAVHRKTPSTIFLIPSIIPFVPGGRIFRVMAAWLYGDQETLLLQGRYTITVAGAVAMGIIIGITVVRMERNMLCLFRAKINKRKLNENNSQ